MKVILAIISNKVKFYISSLYYKDQYAILEPACHYIGPYIYPPRTSIKVISAIKGNKVKFYISSLYYKDQHAILEPACHYIGPS